MSFYDIIALATIMTLLAAIPSSSVALVVIRASTMGVKQGVITSLGVAAGDLVFVAMVLLGLTALSEQLGALFVVIRYLAAGYLIWFGLNLIRNHAHRVPQGKPSVPPNGARTTSASFLSGLLLTLSDIKAVFFYASLFPAFIDPITLRNVDIAAIFGITLFAVGGIKVVYAVSASKMMNLSGRLYFQTKAKPVAGAMMIATGSYLFVKT
ncbi:LysE family translocator [Zhongshania sp.]|uniref:LysE family translocator n=1 Tax=Zhongshania sp. TaxID=1971902 RepID=UPI003568B1C5